MDAILKCFAFLTFAVFLAACGSAPPTAFLAPNWGEGDVHVPAKDVSRVNVGSVNFYSVSVFLYADQTPQNYFSFTLDRRDVREGYSSRDVADLDRQKIIDAN